MADHTKDLTPFLSASEINNLECYAKFVYVNKSSVHGIGVFASKSFQPTEIIEVFPIIPLYFRTHYQGDARVIDYCVVKNCECEECKRHGAVLYLRLGYGGIYNHQDENNAEITIDYKNLLGICRATRNIQVNDEVFINYGLSYRFPEGKTSIRQ